MSTTVTSDVPVISERAMYWPGASTSVARGAQQLRRDADGDEVGPGGRARRRGPRVPDLHPAGEPDARRAAQVQVTYPARRNGATVVKTYTVTGDQPRSTWP